MRLLKFSTVIVALGAVGVAAADNAPATDGATVNITSPSDGAKIQVSGTQVAYSAAPGPKGERAVVTIDGTQAAVLNELKGNYTLDKLALGDHTVCVKVVDKGLEMTWAERCIRVTAANPSLWTY